MNINIFHHIYWFWDINISVIVGGPTKCGCFSVPCIRYDLPPIISAYIMLKIPGQRASFICTQCIHRCITRPVFVRSITVMWDMRIDDKVMSRYLFLDCMLLISIDAILLFTNIASSSSFLLLHNYIFAFFIMTNKKNKKIRK